MSFRPFSADMGPGLERRKSGVLGKKAIQGYPVDILILTPIAKRASFKLVAGGDARPTGVFMLSGEAKAHEHLRDYS